MRALTPNLNVQQKKRMLLFTKALKEVFFLSQIKFVIVVLTFTCMRSCNPKDKGKNKQAY